MKLLKSFVPMLSAVAALFAGAASAADEKEDLLSRFDRELLTVMSGFAEARESGVASSFRQSYMKTFDKFISDANTLEGIITELGIGEDLNLATHTRNIRTAFQTPAQTAASGSSSNQKGNNRSSSGSAVSKANDPLSRMTGKSLSDYTGIGGASTSSSGSASAQSQSPAGFSFHMAGNAVQTLSSLGFGLRNGKYSVSPRYRRILPYLELKRDVEYFNTSYEHFDTLISNQVWRSDFEKRLKRMNKLAVQVQPVYRAYFPNRTLSIGAETERLARVYSKFVEYVRATEQAEAAKKRNQEDSRSAFDQIRQSNIPDKGLILKDYDTAAAHFAEIFADMDSVDWTANQFSADGPSAGKDDEAKASAKKAD